MKLAENAVVAGRFQLNHMLQKGGMGSVWHATHLGLEVPCAIKFLKGELLENTDIIARFQREAKAAAQLRSTNVVQILDHGVCEGTPYIAMELLEGEDLSARLKRSHRLEPNALYELMSGVCRALSKAHAMGIVHRDLKPGNIFLARDDDREIAKVLDFGVAKTQASEVLGSATKTGALLGTPYYMSPEQAQGNRAVDFRSDLWSLAVICFQCLTGRLPFQSDALGDLFVKIIVGPIPTPSELAAVPPGFDKWWAKAASREPSERFQSAKEFADSLALVCGVSHVSSVIDRSPVHIQSDSLGPGMAPGPAAALGAIAPPASDMSPTLTRPIQQAAPPSPGSAAAAPTGPGLTPHTPPPGLAVPAGQVTPAPLSRSFVAAEPAQPTRPRSSALGIAVAAGCFLVTCLLVGGFVVRARSSRNDGSTAATETQWSNPKATSTTAPAASNSAPSPPASAAAAPPSTGTGEPWHTAAPSWPPSDEAPAPPSTATSPIVSAEPTSTPPSTRPPHGAAHPRSPASTPKSPSPAASQGKQPIDMGF